ncbi:phosphatidylinositol polyphosphate 5-phosphatase type IV-like [Babylonia areolata]|uniref:phosphatidylinositol polyphosphate 5-phosphatase type IV-like n=1 Tax=Babylonia areolata TaxID=304850 RepID=UPI003FD31A35
MAAENEPDSPVRGKAKKKSALTKLVERKKRVGGSDVDSEYGSRVSLQGGSAVPRSAVPLEPQVIVESKRSSGSHCVPCKSASTSDSKGKPQPRPRRNSTTMHSEVGSDNVQSVRGKSDGQGDVPSDPPASNRSGPTDSTIYRFRNMRMAAEQPENADGKLQGPFIPKPPSTPRTPRTAVVKREKRNHEAALSGDEPEVGPKRHSEGSNETHNNHIKGHSQHSMTSEEVHTNHKQSPKVSPVKSSVDGGEVEDAANGTIDQLHQHYQRLMEVDSTKDSPPALRHSSFGSHLAESTLSNTSRSARLAPIHPKHQPPPLEADVSSHGLRTAYKADPSYRRESSSMMGRLNKRVSDGMLMAGHNGSQTRLGSDNISLTSTSVMPVITTREARSRSYLQGSVSSGAMSILGVEELERYFPDRRIHVFVGSWNMNELKNLSASVNDFILPETCEYVQDVYVVGTQENEINRKEWEVQLQETLGPSHVLFHAVSYGSLHLAVFVRRDLIWFCSVPEDDVVSLRAVAMVKTKGAIGICFSLFGTSFLFINCHLTSDRSSSKNKNRLLDYHRVTRELRLPRPVTDKHVHPAIKQPDVTARFDCVFWCGDLNFRLERRRVAVEGKVSQMTDSDDIPHFEELLGADQLSKYITEGKIFEGFQEGRINFQPTFKFDINSDKYDSSSKMRIPSYTDRILWRTRKKNQVSCLHYDAVMNIKVSDHRAVYAFFEASLRPGRDNIQLCAGHFDRDIYVEANKRRAQAQVNKGHKNSSVCTVQ